MEIVLIDIDKLTPYENNPRINDGAVDDVARSIQMFGFKVPMIIDKDNVVIAGHTRLKAAKKLGLGQVPCIVADDLTEDEAKALRLVENKTGEIARWDCVKLEDEIENIELDLDIFDIGDYGVSSYIDLLEESIMSNEDKIQTEKQTRYAFAIPYEYTERLDAYIEENGKQKLAMAILKEAGIL